jgi:general secretion pathway protein B
MSYVLDALRRAEADRHRGEVPDLHAPPGVGMASAAARDAGPAAHWPWLAAALLGVLALAVWWWASADRPQPAARPAPVAAVEVPVALTTVAPRTGAPATAAIQVPAESTGPVPPPVALPEPAAPRRPAPPADLPALSFGGAFDSPDPKARMLIINGQVWREGDEPLPGLRLERISLHAAQFRYQGRMVEVAYDGTPRGPDPATRR